MVTFVIRGSRLYMMLCQSKQSSCKNLEVTLLILSSALLGIWAVKETIALRNILIVAGTFFSTYYIALEFKRGALNDQLTTWKLAPFVLLTLVFFWVITHYFFFAIDPINQLKELKSTWLRSLLASIVGLGTGLALRNHPNRLNILWLGIFIAFLILFYQYIPRAFSQNKLYVPDYAHYLFHLKINTVLMGTLLIAGVDGALLDHIRAIQYGWRNFRLWYLSVWLLATGLSLWAFVFIVDTRNGVGLSIILYSFWLICALVFILRSQIYRSNLRVSTALLIPSLGLCLILYFAFLQVTVNKGWHTFLKDAKLAVQIDLYPHWQNPAQFGYPKHKDGQVVTPNNYERIAWGIAGTRAIFQNPLGVGSLAYPFSKHPQAPPYMLEGPNVSGIATHSGWVELGLAFGLPMLGLIFAILLIAFINAIKGAYPAKMTAFSLIVLILFLYLVGEVAIDHGLEILFYFLAFVPALMLVKPYELLSES